MVLHMLWDLWMRLGSSPNSMMEYVGTIFINIWSTDIATAIHDVLSTSFSTDKLVRAHASLTSLAQKATSTSLFNVNSCVSFVHGGTCDHVFNTSNMCHAITHSPASTSDHGPFINLGCPLWSLSVLARHIKVVLWEPPVFIKSCIFSKRVTLSFCHSQLNTFNIS